MKILYGLCLAVFLLLSGRADATTHWALDDCLAIAMGTHPSLAGAAAQIAIEEARLDRAGVADRLTVSGTASTSRVATRDSENASYSIGASAGVKVYDANRNKYTIDAQRNTLSATEADAKQTISDVRTNVKSSYMALLLNQTIVSLRRASADAFAYHLEQAKAFYEAGSNPWYDVTKAEVDLGNAQLALVEAVANVEVARDDLLNAMGVADRISFDIEPVSWDIPAGTEQEAEELALENRDDYKAGQLKLMAGQATLSAEARANAASVSLSGGYSGGGDDIFDLGKGWNVGVNVSVPIVDGGETKARVEIAQGQIRSQEAAQEKLKQDILLEVRKVVTDLARAREGIRISDLTVINAEENRRLAEGRYEMGVGDPLEVTDALVSLTEAHVSAYQARHDLQTALISLERAIGIEFNR